VVVRRALTQAEERYKAETDEDDRPDEVWIEPRIVLAAVPEPAKVIALLQTLQLPPAS
jgi:hypothetical protein